MTLPNAMSSRKFPDAELMYTDAALMYTDAELMYVHETASTSITHQ